jgi:LysR family transcriptional regulator, chromosome initiation inhibitor
MRFNAAGVEALVAIVDHGTFDAAARALHVTPSAVSQRIRSLETEAGQVLLRRTTPCQATEAGTRLVRLGRQMQLLAAEARAEMIAETGRVAMNVAINADSLATWFRDVLTDAAGRDDLTLRLVVEDQAHSADLLRRGEAVAAVTSEPQPVQGCRSEHLGFLRYRPAATPELAQRWRTGRGWDWRRMPVVVFNSKDRLQHQVLREHGVETPEAVHLVPTSEDFRVAVECGLGWGMLPDPQLQPLRRTGHLVTLGARTHVDVHLHWQHWRLDSPRLATLTDDVRRAARVRLRQ